MIALKKRWVAFLLAFCMALTDPIGNLAIASDGQGQTAGATAANQGAILEASEEALTVSQVGAYPVDLTAEGNLDWLYFNSTDAQA